MQKLLFLSFIAILTLSSCKKWQHKYPEDTERTKLTPKERLTGKWWTLQNASVNGVDYTDSVHEMFGKYQIYFSTSISSSFNGIDRYFGNVKTELEPAFTSTWRLKDNDENMSIVDANGNGGGGNNSSKVSIVPCYINYQNFSSDEYLILKLSISELNISIKTKGSDSIIINNFIAN